MAGSQTLGPRLNYVYTDDANNAWTVRMYQVIAQAGGFTPGESDLGGWPYKSKDMRHMTCYDPTTGHRIRVPIDSIGNTDWESAPTISVGYLTGSRTYNVVGFHGERKISRDVNT